jgi:hypothetical protein
LIWITTGVCIDIFVYHYDCGAFKNYKIRLFNF